MNMDTNSWLILILAIMVILMAVRSGSGGQGIRLARLERKVDALLGKLEVNLDANVDSEVKRLAQSGRKIDAIKRYRELSGAGLKEAKDYVERL